MPLFSILVAVVVAIAVMGAVLAVTAKGQQGYRRVLALIGALAVFASTGTYLYGSIINLHRVDEIDRYITIGVRFNALALITSVFAVSKSRPCLVSAACCMFALWFGAAMSVV